MLHVTESQQKHSRRGPCAFSKWHHCPTHKHPSAEQIPGPGFSLVWLWSPLNWSRFIVKAMFIFYRTPKEIFCSKNQPWAHCSFLKFSELPYQIVERIRIVNLLSDNYLLQADCSFACSDSGFALYNFNLLIIFHLWGDLAFFPALSKSYCKTFWIQMVMFDPNMSGSNWVSIPQAKPGVAALK